MHSDITYIYIYRYMHIHTDMCVYTHTCRRIHTWVDQTLAEYAAFGIARLLWCVAKLTEAGPSLASEAKEPPMRLGIHKIQRAVFMRSPFPPKERPDRVSLNLNLERSLGGRLASFRSPAENWS